MVYIFRGGISERLFCLDILIATELAVLDRQNVMNFHGWNFRIGQSEIHLKYN